jgi:hypothetical protein
VMDSLSNRVKFILVHSNMDLEVFKVLKIWVGIGLKINFITKVKPHPSVNNNERVQLWMK